MKKIIIVSLLNPKPQPQHRNSQWAITTLKEKNFFKFFICILEWKKTKKERCISFAIILLFSYFVRLEKFDQIFSRLFKKSSQLWTFE